MTPYQKLLGRDRSIDQIPVTRIIMYDIRFKINCKETGLGH